MSKKSKVLPAPPSELFDLLERPQQERSRDWGCLGSSELCLSQVDRFREALTGGDFGILGLRCRGLSDRDLENFAERMQRRGCPDLARGIPIRNPAPDVLRNGPNIWVVAIDPSGVARRVKVQAGFLLNVSKQKQEPDIRMLDGQNSTPARALSPWTFCVELPL